jgi:serine protease SohB
MQELLELAVFAGKAIIVLMTFAGIVIVIALAVARNSMKGELEVELLGEKWDLWEDLIAQNSLSKKELKDLSEEKKKSEKSKDQEKPTQRLFVLDFVGDIHASQIDRFQSEVTAILLGKREGDTVVLRINSPGGVVMGYGLAAAQILRLRSAGIQVLACVDQVAASGGYMMAVTAHKIYSAPFAIVGSIGVIAGLPNFNRLLKKYDVDYKEYTAGEYKRTVSTLGEITEKGEAKFKEQLELVHGHFKDFVHEYRPQMDLSQIATGEYWHGVAAVKMGLVDHLATSEDVILGFRATHKIIHLTFHKKEKLKDKISGILGKSFRMALNNFLSDLDRNAMFM